MRLIKAASILSWMCLKESRTLQDFEYVDWCPEPHLFTADDFIDPLLLLTSLFKEQTPLSKFLRYASAKRTIEARPGYVATSGDSSMFTLALKQALVVIEREKTAQADLVPDLRPLSNTLAELLNTVIQSGPVYQQELFSGVNLSDAIQSMLARSPEVEDLVYLNRLLLEVAYPQAIRKRPSNDLSFSTKLVFVSHRWITANHPDPDGAQIRELQRRLGDLIKEEKEEFASALVFYDYSSMLQRPRTSQEEALFNRDILQLHRLSRRADKFLILSEGYVDYKNRGWCFFEFMVARRRRVHLFKDQAQIVEDLAFLDEVMPSPYENGSRGFVTPEKLNYRINFEEAEVIILAFQHLGSCRTTHSEDANLLRLQLARHFNSREMTAFGRLITGVAKFFDVTLVLASDHEPSSGPVLCRPFFEQPEWQRLHLPGGKLSKFAVPQDRLQELSTHDCIPLLRLTLPGVSDFQAFLRRFQTEAEWQKYVVAPAAAAGVSGNLGAECDCFPTINYVVHTILDRPPSFAVGPQCLFMPITRDVEEALGNH